MQLRSIELPRHQTLRHQGGNGGPVETRSEGVRQHACNANTRCVRAWQGDLRPWRAPRREPCYGCGLRSEMYVSRCQARCLGTLAAAWLGVVAFPPLAGATPPAMAPASEVPSGQGRAGKQLIYRGTYYRRGAAASASRLFWYERWHEAAGGRWRSTHVHQRLNGGIVLRQSVLHSADYELLQFDSEQQQTGVRAVARVLGPGRVRLQRTTPGTQGEKAKVEAVDLSHEHTLVVGPTLYGIMLRHWAQLLAGQSLTVDYLSIERLDTYAFELRLVASDDGTTTFELAPSGFFLALLVSPLRIRFASKSRQVLSYEGPSPVLLEQSKELESFEARIEYSERATPFR